MAIDFGHLDAAEAVDHLRHVISMGMSRQLLTLSERLCPLEAADSWDGIAVQEQDVDDVNDIFPSAPRLRRSKDPIDRHRRASNRQPVPPLRETPAPLQWMDAAGVICPRAVIRQVSNRHDRLNKRSQRVAAYTNPKHATRMRGAARRRALSSSWGRRRSLSEKEVVTFGHSDSHWDDWDIDGDYYSDYSDYSDWGSYMGDGPNYGDLQDFETRFEITCQSDSSIEYFGQCPVCMEERALLELNCAHAFCMRCLLRQLASRWNGVQISFNYLQCGICRQQVGHRKLQVPMCANLAFKERVELLALNKYVDEGLNVAPTSAEEMRAQAMTQIAVFMCNTCSEPFCGGRVECVRQHDMSASDMICNLCEWSTSMGESKDNRCMIHGHRFAIFKCDFCCSVATYRCGGHTNFCERCHQQGFSNRYHPCLGASCSLSIPHPCILSEEGEGSVQSFVLGCAACQGSEDNNGALIAVGSPGEFGYPHRKWEAFTGGDMLIAAVGEREVRDRLRSKHPTALQIGESAECAERLLLLELKMQSCEDLLAVNGGHRDVLARRLAAVGMRQDGSSVECAQRLLMLLSTPVASLGREHLSVEDDVESDDDIDLPPLIPLDAEHHSPLTLLA